MKKDDRSCKLKKTLSAIDLFCGAGGLSLGFEEAGFNILLGLDSWSDAVATYVYNFPNAAGIVGDITKIDPIDLLKKQGIERNEVDVIIGGPPCQGFSLSGNRVLTDPRNSLYKHFVRFVSQIRPKAFVMENVPGLLSLFDGKVEKSVISDFQNLGYIVIDKVLFAENYGVPQKRRRVFFVGIRKDIYKGTFYYPKPQYGENLKPFISCKEAISDLDFVEDGYSLEDEANYVNPPLSEYQKIMRIGSKQLYNHSSTLHTKKTQSIISLVPDGGNYKDLPAELQGTRKVHIAWTRMNSKEPCFTIDCGHNHQFHYSRNRVPTVRESARIQSFPDKFVFLGKRTSQYRQVGNAVPPLLAKALAQALIKYLKNGE